MCGFPSSRRPLSPSLTDGIPRIKCEETRQDDRPLHTLYEFGQCCDNPKCLSQRREMQILSTFQLCLNQARLTGVHHAIRG